MNRFSSHFKAAAQYPAPTVRRRASPPTSADSCSPPSPRSSSPRSGARSPAPAWPARPPGRCASSSSRSPARVTVSVRKGLGRQGLRHPFEAVFARVHARLSGNVATTLRHIHPSRPISTDHCTQGPESVRSRRDSAVTPSGIRAREAVTRTNSPDWRMLARIDRIGRILIIASASMLCVHCTFHSWSTRTAPARGGTPPNPSSHGGDQ